MRIVIAAEPWQLANGAHIDAETTMQAVVDVWQGGAPHADVAGLALSSGGPRAADVLRGTSSFVGGVEVKDSFGGLVLAPRDSAYRWNPTDLVAALIGLGASAKAAGLRRTVIVPVGDADPAGDPTELWGSGLAATRAALASLNIVVLTSATRPLLGFKGMSAATMEGREGDPAIAAAAQEQENRWAAVASEAEALIPGSTDLLAGGHLSDSPNSGAGGGLAYCLMALGARAVDGATWVAEASGFANTVADLEPAALIAVAPRLTASDLDYGIASAVATHAGRIGIPAVVITGMLGVGKRDLMAAGIVSAYECEPGIDGLREQVVRVAHTWSPTERG